MTQVHRSKARILCLLEVLEQLTDEDNRLSKSAIMKEMNNKGVSISIGKKALTDSLEILEDIGYDIDCQYGGEKGNTYCLLSRDFDKRERHLAFPFAMVWEEECYYIVGNFFDLSGQHTLSFCIDRVKQVTSLDDASKNPINSKEGVNEQSIARAESCHRTSKA